MIRRRQSGTADAATPRGTRIYAVGDIHGRLDLLRELEDVIAADVRAAPAARTVAVYLGDYVDRGPSSAGVIDRLANGSGACDETIHLEGNHDAMFRAFLEDGDMAETWFMNGGLATLESYGVGRLSVIEAFADAAGVRDELSRAVPAAHREFLTGLAAYHREGDYIFVHAGLRPGVELERQDAFDLMWIREEFLDFEGDFGAVVVHGHTPRPRPEVRANRIGIDTGAFRTDRLTCLVLEGAERRFLQT